MEEWLVPESLLRPMYGEKQLPSGRYVPLLRVSGEEFVQRSNPAIQYLDREIAKLRQERASRQSAQSARNPRSEPADRSEVWVIHGRDEEFRRTIFELLRAVYLRPIEFNYAVARSGSGSPIVLDLVLREIHNAPAIVALLTPDDDAVLREELRAEPKDAAEHVQAGSQPRPNVILETGMALATLRDKTILVTKGQLREISDILGVHSVRWENTIEKRSELVERLRGLDCPVVTSGKDWQKVPVAPVESEPKST